jgi:hypothetical protein
MFSTPREEKDPLTGDSSFAVNCCRIVPQVFVSGLGSRVQ